jgi:hypothetical protein
MMNIKSTALLAEDAAAKVFWVPKEARARPSG